MKLPRDLVHDAQRSIVTMEKEGYIFYIDDLLAKARDAAQDQRLKQKIAILNMVKEYLPKAMKSGASEEFQARSNAGWNSSTSREIPRHRRKPGRAPSRSIS